MKKLHLLQEFKKFISRGNVIELAVGLVMGTAFTAIVRSAVNDIIMPLAGTLLGGVQLGSLKLIIREKTEQSAELAITYGNFLQHVVDFLIISFVVFLIVRSFNHIKDLMEAIEKKAKERELENSANMLQKEEQKVTPIPQEIALLTEIRDLLRQTQQ